MSTSERQTLRSGASGADGTDEEPGRGDARGTDDRSVVEPDTGPAWLRGWWPFVIVAAPFAVLFALLAVHSLTLDWSPLHDFAFIEMRVRDVGTGQTPLVGPYSRFGWSHPGPMLFYVLAIPYRLFGGHSQGLLLGAVLINATSVAGILLLARRRGGVWTLAGTAVGVALLLHGIGTTELTSPWNPMVTVLPMVVFLLLAWSLALRDWAMLPWTVLVASFLVQTHVSFGLLVIAALAAAGLFAIFARSPSTAQHLRRTLVIAAALGAVLWLPVVLDQLTGTHNASKTVRFFSSSQEGRPGVRAAAGVTAVELAPIGPWLSSAETLEAFSGSVAADPPWRLVLPVAGLALGAVISARRRDRVGLALIVVATSALGATFVSVTRINGALVPYLLRFSWAVALVVWLAVARAVAPALAALALRLWHAGEREQRAVSWAVVPLAVAVLAGLVGLVTIPPGVLGAETPEADESANLQAIEDAVVPTVKASAGEGVVLVRPADTVIQFPAPNTRGLAAGLVSELRKQGVDARAVDDDWQFADGPIGKQLFGEPRVDDGGPVAGTVTIVGANKLDAFVPAPGARELYRVEDRAAVDEAHRLEAELARDFTAVGVPEAIPKLRTTDIRWLVFAYPPLGQFGEKINRLAAVQQPRREAVFWHDGR